MWPPTVYAPIPDGCARAFWGVVGKLGSQFHYHVECLRVLVLGLFGNPSRFGHLQVLLWNGEATSDCGQLWSSTPRREVEGVHSYVHPVVVAEIEEEVVLLDLDQGRQSLLCGQSRREEQVMGFRSKQPQPIDPLHSSH